MTADQEQINELRLLLLAARNALLDKRLETGPRGYVIGRINAALADANAVNA